QGKTYEYPKSFFLLHAIEHGVEHRTEIKSRSRSSASRLLTWTAGSTRRLPDMAVRSPATTPSSLMVVTVATPPDALDRGGRRVMREHPVPGVAVGIIADGEETVHGFGITNVDHP